MARPLLALLIAFSLAFPLGCDLVGSEEDGPEYVGMWISESDRGDFYIHLTEETLRQYLVQGQDTTCVSRAWKIADYDPEANVMFFRSAINQANKWHVNVQADTMTAGPIDDASFQRRYHRTDDDPRSRVECTQNAQALRERLPKR